MYSRFLSWKSQQNMNKGYKHWNIYFSAGTHKLGMRFQWTPLYPIQFYPVCIVASWAESRSKMWTIFEHIFFQQLGQANKQRDIWMICRAPWRFQLLRTSQPICTMQYFPRVKIQSQWLIPSWLKLHTENWRVAVLMNGWNPSPWGEWMGGIPKSMPNIYMRHLGAFWSAIIPMPIVYGKWLLITVSRCKSLLRKISY